jgi:5-methylthioribose kinase
MSEDNVYTLSDIVQRLGPATEQEARVELEGFTNEHFIAKGRRIGTPRLVKEVARNYGILLDWLSTATAAQKDLLGFVGTDWLRIAAYVAHQADIRHETLTKSQSLASANKHVRSSKADELMNTVKHTRERIYTLLQNVAGGIATWKAAIDGAYSTPDTRVPMTDALDAMCKVAEKMVNEPTDGMKIRLARNNVTLSHIQAWRDLAESARQAQREATAVATAPSVIQSEVDTWDGMTISFFEQFVDAVEDARRIDPTIPAPSIIGLRSWFGRTTRKSAPEQAPETSGTTPSTSGT